MWSRRWRSNPLFVLTKNVVYPITYAGLEPELGIKPRLPAYEAGRLSLADTGWWLLTVLIRLFLIENQASCL